jgi:hypothetical protein
MTENKNLVDHMWSPEDFVQFKQWLTRELHHGVVTVNFTKKDGTDRSMRCTLSTTEIPVVVQETLLENQEPTKPRKINPDVRTVYDVESQTWKSFRWDSIKSVNYTLEK